MKKKTKKINKHIKETTFQMVKWEQGAGAGAGGRGLRNCDLNPTNQSSEKIYHNKAVILKNCCQVVHD